MRKITLFEKMKECIVYTMPPLQEHNTVKTTRHGVRYHDASVLLRPSRFPKSEYSALAIFIAAAVIIGGFFLFSNLDSIYNGPKRAQDQIQTLVSEYTRPSVPAISDYMFLDTEEVISEMRNNGFLVYDVDGNAGANSKLDIYTYKSHITEDELPTLYSTGIAKSSLLNAGRLLVGSSWFTEDTTDGFVAKVHYADFWSGSEQAAISTAIDIQKWGEADFTDSGVDDSGNTYQTGTIELNSRTYTFRISVIQLKQMYNKDLSDTAMYVGIRMSR